MVSIIFLLPIIGVKSLFTEKLASKVGDLVTVIIVEETYARNRAETRADQRGSVSGSAKQEGIPMLGPGVSGELEGKNLHYGYGRHLREGEVKAFVTAKVIEVLPNGNLKIQGEKRLYIGQDDLILKVSGIARKEDIGEGNQILSTYLAEAKIEYLGKGVIERAVGKGVFRRALDIVWSPIALLGISGILYIISRR